MGNCHFLMKESKSSSSEDFLSSSDYTSEEYYGQVNFGEEEEDISEGYHLFNSGIFPFNFTYHDYHSDYTDESEEEDQSEDEFYGNEMNNNNLLIERLILTNYEQRPDFALVNSSREKAIPTLEEVLEQSKTEYDLSQKIATFFQDSERIKSVLSKLPNVDIKDSRFQQFYNNKI